MDDTTHLQKILVFLLFDKIRYHGCDLRDRTVPVSFDNEDLGQYQLPPYARPGGTTYIVCLRILAETVLLWTSFPTYRPTVSKRMPQGRRAINALELALEFLHLDSDPLSVGSQLLVGSRVWDNSLRCPRKPTLRPVSNAVWTPFWLRLDRLR